MSVLHRLSLGYSKTAGEIQKAAAPLLTSPPSQLTFRKMEEKKAYCVGCFSATWRTPHENFFSHLSPEWRRSVSFKSKKKKKPKKLFIKCTHKNNKN